MWSIGVSMSVLMTAFKAPESDEGINPHRDWLLNTERKSHMLSLTVLDTSGEIFSTLNTAFMVDDLLDQ